MQRLLLLSSFLFTTLSLLITGCRDKRQENSEKAPDTIAAEVVADTIADTLTVEEPAPPAAADGVFGDFIFNFMRNRNFQRERVKFPLPVTEGGQHRSIEAGAWRHDRMFSREDMYAVLTDGSKKASRQAQQDSAMISVLDMAQSHVKHYVFHKENGAWMLTAINSRGTKEEDEADFYNFLGHFSADGDFRRRHVAQSFDLIVCDPDTYEPLQGVADAVQWDDYAPELPSDRLAIVTSGTTLASGNLRVLEVTSLEGAMTSFITFRKQGGRWEAVKLENN